MQFKFQKTKESRCEIIIRINSLCGFYFPLKLEKRINKQPFIWGTSSKVNEINRILCEKVIRSALKILNQDWYLQLNFR